MAPHQESGRREGRDYYVRQLRDWKGSADLDNIDPSRLFVWTPVCLDAGQSPRPFRGPDRGSPPPRQRRRSTARSHVRHRHADQNEKDYAELKAAADSRRIEVVSGYQPQVALGW